MNRFTLTIHNKGWTVKDACEHWGIHYDTYNSRCNNSKMHNQLECLCNGLVDKTAKIYLLDGVTHRNGGLPGFGSGMVDDKLSKLILDWWEGEQFAEVHGGRNKYNEDIDFVKLAKIITEGE